MLRETTKEHMQATLDPQLRSLGFVLNPFEYLEASADPFLGEYFVGHEAITVAWEELPALIFAPAGGGKTAMRIYTARACWATFGNYQPFPIPYVLQPEAVAEQRISPDAHLSGIASAGTKTLLVSLAFRPEHVFMLDLPSRRRVATLLDQWLPGRLWRYLEKLRERGDPRSLINSGLTDRAFLLPDLPDPQKVRQLCDALGEAIPKAQIRLSPQEAFDELIALLLDVFKFRSIFLLVDGVDGSVETLTSPQVAVDWLMSLFSYLEEWTARSVFLKAFLPLEMKELVRSQLDVALPILRQAQLVWTPALLADLIRRRIYVGSVGVFGSLDAISSEALRDVETMLVKYIRPLPREAIILVRRLLEIYVARTAEGTGPIEPDDIKNAVAWYQQQQTWFPPALNSGTT